METLLETSFIPTPPNGTEFLERKVNMTFKQIAKHPIYSGVIATLIAAFICWLCTLCWQGADTFFRDVLKYIAGIATVFWNYMGTTTPIYMWIVYTVVILLFSIFLYISSKVYQSFQEADLDEYTCDVFEGIKWRWSIYFGKMSEPIPYCPHCDMRLTEVDANSYGTKLYYCQKCQFASKKYNGSEWYDLGERVPLLIEQKINTGDWKEVVRSYKR